MGLRFTKTEEAKQKIEERDARTSRFFAESTPKEAISETQKSQEMLPEMPLEMSLEIASTSKKQHAKPKKRFHWTSKQTAITLIFAPCIALAVWQLSQSPAKKLGAPSRFNPVYTLNTPNANDHYIKAVNALKIDSIGDWESNGLTDLMTEKWQNPQAKAASLASTRAILEQNREALTALSQAQGLPYTPQYFPKTAGKYFKLPVTYPVKDGLEMPAPDFARIHLLSRLGYADARMLAKQGKYAPSVARSIDVITLGNHLKQDRTTLINGMVGTLVEGIGMDGVLESVDYLDASTARQQIARLEKLPEVSTVEMMQDEQRRTQATPMTGFIGSLYEKQIGIASLPYYKAQKFRDVKATGISFLDGLVPDSSRIHWANVKRNTEQQILLTRLALRAFRVEHGTLPDSLDILVSQGYLKQLPMDGFSMTSKDVLRYEASTGKVWSVGNNGKDDHNTGDDLLKNF